MMCEKKCRGLVSEPKHKEAGENQYPRLKYENLFRIAVNYIYIRHLQNLKIKSIPNQKL